MIITSPPTQGTHEFFVKAFPLEVDCLHCEAELTIQDPDEVDIETRGGKHLLTYLCIACRGYNEEDPIDYDITQPTAQAERTFRKNPLRYGTALRPREV